MSATWDTETAPTTSWTLNDVGTIKMYGKGSYGGGTYYGQGNVVGSLAATQDLND